VQPINCLAIDLGHALVVLMKHVRTTVSGRSLESSMAVVTFPMVLTHRHIGVVYGQLPGLTLLVAKAGMPVHSAVVTQCPHTAQGFVTAASARSCDFARHTTITKLVAVGILMDSKS